MTASSAQQQRMQQPNDAAITIAAPVFPKPANRLIVTICTILATLMQSLDSTIANVALPYMQGTMSASQEEINWVLTSYIVAAAIMTAPTGFLAARFGRTRLFVTAVVGFTVASALCGLAESLGQIVVFRIVQGMFGAALVPLSQSVMYELYPPEQRAKAMGLWTMGVMMGPICGPILGGWLTDHYSWRWVFYINVPFGIVTAIGLLTFLKESSHGGSATLDWIGFGALSLAIGSFQMMLDRGETLDWFASREIILEACIAGVAFYIFLVQFCLAPKPFLSPKLFADRNFTVGAILYAIMGLIMYASLALLAPYLQTLMDYPVVTAGIVLAPRGAGLMLAALICGRVMGRVSARLLVGIGFVVGAYALHEMTLWTPDIPEFNRDHHRLHPGDQHRLPRNSDQHHRLCDTASRNADGSHQYLQPDAQSRQRDRHFHHRRPAADQHTGQSRVDRRRRQPVQPRLAGGRRLAVLGHRIAARHRTARPGNHPPGQDHRLHR